MLDLWAILGGISLGLGLSIIAGLIIGVAEGMGMLRKMPEMLDIEDEEELEELERRHAEELRNDTAFHVGSLIISLLAQVLAGYYTAYWADFSPYLHAGAVGALAVAITFLFDWRKYAPAWIMWAWVALAIPASLAGAWIFAG